MRDWQHRRVCAGLAPEHGLQRNMQESPGVTSLGGLVQAWYHLPLLSAACQALPDLPAGFGSCGQAQTVMLHSAVQRSTVYKELLYSP